MNSSHSMVFKMIPLSKEEWDIKKNELARKYFPKLHHYYDSDDSVPPRSSELWVPTSAPSLSPKRPYTPLPSLIIEHVRSQDESIDQVLEISCKDIEEAGNHEVEFSGRKDTGIRKQIDVATQTDFGKTKKYSKKRRDSFEYLKRNFFVGEMKTYNICRCKEHTCEAL